jgi:hypothetical protein
MGEEISLEPQQLSRLQPDAFAARTELARDFAMSSGLPTTGPNHSLPRKRNEKSATVQRSSMSLECQLLTPGQSTFSEFRVWKRRLAIRRKLNSAEELFHATTKAIREIE